MLIFLLGLLLGLAASVLIGMFFTKHMIGKGHYASAIYDEKSDTWQVRGRFLHTAGRIHQRIKRGDGVKYII